jgi:hypothetical protein
MMKMEIRGKFKFPNMDFSKELQLVAQRIIIPEIAGHIHEGTDINDIPYPPLADSTIKAKGHDRPLIGKDRELIRSPYYVVNKGKNTFVIGINSVRKKVAEYLQIEGVKSKKYGKRFFNFFGINDVMLLKAKNIVNDAIKKRTNG